jgi:hypothetical protein
MENIDNVPAIKRGRPKTVSSGRKKNYSNFFVTLNTNKFAGKTGLTREDKIILRDLDAAWKDYMRFPPERWLEIPEGTTEGNVISIAIDGGTEVETSKRRMINAHILIETVHYTRLKFKIRDLEDFVKEKLNLSGMYAKVYAIRPGVDTDNVRAYVIKERYDPSQWNIDDVPADE